MALFMTPSSVFYKSDVRYFGINKFIGEDTYNLTIFYPNIADTMLLKGECTFNK